MDSAESLQLICMRALTADAESVDSETAELLEIFVIRGCGIALDGELRILFNLEIAVRGVNNARNAADVKIRGSSAADVDRVYRIIAAARAPVLHLQNQRVGIMLDYTLVVRNKGAEIAIIALALAERNVYVKPQGLAVLFTKH